MSKLIALGGKLRAGKDAIGDYLEAEHGYVKMGMSDALNAALLELNPWIPIKNELGEALGRYKAYHDAVGYVEAKKNPEVRRLLQALGTEVGRDMISPNVWVDIAERTIRDHWDAGRSVVITAIRFPNEIEMVRGLGGKSVWVERPVEARMAGTEATSEEVSGHASENSVFPGDFDQSIVNDGTLEELYEAVEELILFDSK